MIIPDTIAKSQSLASPPLHCLCYGRVWEAATGDILHTFKEAHKGGVTAVAAAMDGQGYIISAGKDSTIRLWNVVKATLVDELSGHRLWVQSVSLLDTGRLVSASMDTTVSPV